eukprot:TRINITY_DN9377_c0_g1_i1.p1 TRINITY_DN9377_c0_g1~~TRINITY_DN9377_c0_g1_i1.p1  ORF type:complete len:221 (+),score=43.58 TRINITY_DN9377_c0_g1_i1:65-727(+)
MQMLARKAYALASFLTQRQMYNVGFCFISRAIGRNFTTKTKKELIDFSYLNAKNANWRLISTRQNEVTHAKDVVRCFSTFKNRHEERFQTRIETNKNTMRETANTNADGKTKEMQVGVGIARPQFLELVKRRQLEICVHCGHAVLSASEERAMANCKAPGHQQRNSAHVFVPLDEDQLLMKWLPQVKRGPREKYIIRLAEEIEAKKQKSNQSEKTIQKIK